MLGYGDRFNRIFCWIVRCSKPLWGKGMELRASCKYCRRKYTKLSDTHIFCSDQCYLEYGRKSTKQYRGSKGSVMAALPCRECNKPYPKRRKSINRLYCADCEKRIRSKAIAEAKALMQAQKGQ